VGFILFYFIIFILHAFRRADDAYIVGEIYTPLDLKVSDSLLRKDLFPQTVCLFYHLNYIAHYRPHLHCCYYFTSHMKT